MPKLMPNRRGGWMPFSPAAPLVTLGDVARHDRHDLAEAERDDGEVVAAQPQRRRAEQHAEDRRDQRRERQREPERQGEMHDVAGRPG